MTLNILSLFSGIGGLELGLERAGMTTVGQVEIDPYCQRVLAKHWPDVPRHDDVRTTVEWWESETRPHVDVVCQGFPCQDISSANTARTRAGLAGPKSSLWAHGLAVVTHIKPRWVVIENSPEWRRWCPQVRADLERVGYRSIALIMPAGAFGAPHRRPRCVVVADSHGDGESLRTIHAQTQAHAPLPRRDRLESVPRAVGMGDGIPHRVDRLRVLGNAVVPQVSEHIGRQITASLAQQVAS